jgi:hypothetical protein
VSYQIVQDIFRINGGFGQSGENFGGILIKDNPNIVIGASGRNFVNQLKLLIKSENITGGFRIYLPNVTINEIPVIEALQKEYPDFKVYVHQDIVESVQYPRSNFFNERVPPRYKNQVDSVARKFPKQLNNVIGVSKVDSFQAEKTKILLIPFGGPHKGHMFVYSTTHKLVATGIFLKFSPYDETTYYLDYSGNIGQYFKGLEFIDQATSEIHSSAYDEPYFTKGNKIRISTTKNSIEATSENLIELLRSGAKTLDSLLNEYRRFYHLPNISTYNEISLFETMIIKHLEILKSSGKIILKEGFYQLN